jgi:hypothetical protein
MCVNVTAIFSEPPDSVASLFDPRAHSATVVLTSFWGHPTDGERSSLQVTLHGQAITKQWRSAWPYNACREDLQDVQLWGDYYVPLTRACYEVVKELTTLRYYNVSISSSNVSLCAMLISYHIYTKYCFESSMFKRKQMPVNGW